MPTYEIDDKDDNEGDDELQTETHQAKSFDYSKGSHHPQKDGGNEEHTNYNLCA